jgi:hypothetical protein
VVRTCEAIEFNGYTPPYLKEFIARRLDDAFPALAGKVRQFEEDRMQRLCQYIRQTHALTRAPLP